jgi:alkylated DNA repair protein (DNA oxidative demethylase)
MRANLDCFAPLALTMRDLFDAPLITGLRYGEDVVSEAEERALLDHLVAADLSPFRFHGWLGNRKTKSFGWRYDFDDASFAPGEPIPQWLEPLRERAAAFAGLAAADFVHVLLARYDPGAGIGWHRDRAVFDQVVGVSLGTPATLRFRRRKPGGFDRASLELAPRSAYLLSGEARWDWEHRIVPGNQLRCSITFRTLSDKGRTIAAAPRKRNGSPE